MNEACHHEDGVHPGLKGQALRHAMGAAETRCVETQERLTAPRRRVLQLLLESDAPLKAYDLIAAFGETGEPAKPPTVYRALEFLLDAGLIHRIDSLNAFIGCETPEARHAGQFLVCRTCNRVTELDDPSISKLLEKKAKDAGFMADAQTIEIKDLCSDCHAHGGKGSS